MGGWHLAEVVGVSVADSPAGVLVAAGSSSPAVDVAAGGIVLAPGRINGYDATGNAGRQILPPPGVAVCAREVRRVLRLGVVLTVVSGSCPGGGCSSEVSSSHGVRF